MFFFGPPIMIVFLALILAAMVLLVRWPGGAMPAAARLLPPSRSLESLKERFARGEPDKAEVEERRRGLGEQRAQRDVCPRNRRHFP
jgi:putative membrane protein